MGRPCLVLHGPPAAWQCPSSAITTIIILAALGLHWGMFCQAPSSLLGFPTRQCHHMRLRLLNSPRGHNAAAGQLEGSVATLRGCISFRTMNSSEQ